MQFPEFTAGELLIRSCSALQARIAAEKLPHPAHAPDLHPCRRAAPAARFFAMIGLMMAVADNPFRWEVTAEGTPAPDLAADFQCCPVMLKYMLDNGQAQPGPPRIV